MKVGKKFISIIIPILFLPDRRTIWTWISYYNSNKEKLAHLATMFTTKREMLKLQ